MFKISRAANDRLDIEFSGKLDREGMITALNELMQKSEGITHGRILYRINDFDIPSLGAVAVELSRLPQLFKFIRRFDRVAVVSDKAWVRNASQLEGVLIPGLQIKAFESAQTSEAEAWLSTERNP